MRSFTTLGLAAFSLCSCSMSPITPAPQMKAYELSVAASDSQLAIAWHGAATGRDAIHFQWLDFNGKLKGSPMQVTDGARYAFEPDLQFIDRDPLLAWYEKNPTTGALKAYLARLDAGGKTKWRRELGASDAFSRNPVVRIFNGEIAIAWIEAPTGENAVPGVWAQRFNANGNPISEARWIADASRNTWNLNAAVDDKGIFYVVYDAQLTNLANELQLIVVGEEAATHTQISDNDGYASTYPDIGMNAGGRVALTWFDERDGNEEVYLSVGANRDLINGGLPEAFRVTHTVTESIGAYLAWNGDRLALVWCDSKEGQKELYSQMFDAQGMPLADIRRLTSSPEQSSIPSIRAWNAGFIVAWNEYRATGEGVHRPIIFSEARLLRMCEHCADE